MLWGKHPSYMALPKYGPWLKKLCEIIPIVVRGPRAPQTSMGVFCMSSHVDLEFRVTQATVEASKIQAAHSWPLCVDNRGLLPTAEYHTLVEESAVMIGVGQPFWGNAPLDALLYGDDDRDALALLCSRALQCFGTKLQR